MQKVRALIVKCRLLFWCGRYTEVRSELQDVVRILLACFSAKDASLLQGVSVGSGSVVFRWKVNGKGNHRASPYALIVVNLSQSELTFLERQLSQRVGNRWSHLIVRRAEVVVAQGMTKCIFPECLLKRSEQEVFYQFRAVARSGSGRTRWVSVLRIPPIGEDAEPVSIDVAEVDRPSGAPSRGIRVRPSGSMPRMTGPGDWLRRG